MHTVAFVGQALIHFEKRHHAFFIPKKIGGRLAGDIAVHRAFEQNRAQNPVAVDPGTTSSIDLNYNLYYNGSNTGDVPNGANDLTANPLYLDPADANPLDVLLTVSPSSPAVGSGTSNLAPTTDFAGNPRPGSKGYDRGAYQQP